MCKLSETGGMFKCEAGKKEFAPSRVGRLQGYGIYLYPYGKGQEDLQEKKRDGGA